MAMKMKDVLKNKKVTDAALAVVLILIAVVFLFMAGNRFLGKPKIFSADMDKITSAHPALQKAMTDFHEEFRVMQSRLEKLEGEAKVKEQQKMQQQIQQLAIRMQNEAINQIMEDVRSIAKRKGYDYVIDSKSLLVGGADITEEILAAIREKVEKPEDSLKDTSVMPMIPVK